MGKANKKPVWTEEEIAFLGANGSNMNIDELATSLPFHSPLAIKAKAKRLGLEIKQESCLTPEESKFIKDNWGKMSIKAMARELKVTVWVINCEAKRQELPKVKPGKKQVWTPYKIMRLRTLAETMSITELANYFHSTYSAIRKIAKKKNITLLKKDCCWSTEEDLKLRELAPNHSLTEIAAVMHKSETAINSYAKRMGIALNHNFKTAWTKDDDAKLKILASAPEDYSILEIAKIMGWSDRTIRKKAKINGLTLKDDHKGPWTKEETEKFIMLSKSHSVSEIAQELQRSSVSLKGKAAQLGISLKTDRLKWTDEDLDLLKQLIMEKKTLAEIVEILGFSEKSITDKMHRENLRLAAGSHSWTEEEEDYLREYWGVIPAYKIAHHLQRPLPAICQKSWKLGLGSQMASNYEGIVLSDLCDMFKVSSSVISITWVALGLPWHVKKLTPVSEYGYVEIDELLVFLEANQNIWDSRPLEWYALGVEPDWLKLKRHNDGLLPRDYYGAINLNKQQLLKTREFITDIQREEEESSKRVLQP